jgi:hypothetical protein
LSKINSTNLLIPLSDFVLITYSRNQMSIMDTSHLDTMGFMLNKSFSAKLEKSPNHGGWTYVVWPDSAKFFGTKGIVKISGKIDGYPFRASFMAMGDGQHMLPIKAETRKTIGKDVGQTVKVVLEERL